MAPTSSEIDRRKSVKMIMLMEIAKKTSACATLCGRCSSLGMSVATMKSRSLSHRGKITPGTVRNQAVTGFQRHVPDVFGQNLSAAVNGEYADAIAFAQAGFTNRLPHQSRTRRNHDF